MILRNSMEDFSRSHAVTMTNCPGAQSKMNRAAEENLNCSANTSLDNLETLQSLAKYK
jgi:hypothetical protein